MMDASNSFNNIVERAIRPITLGENLVCRFRRRRRPLGGRLPLITTAKQKAIKRFGYRQDIARAHVYGHPISRLRRASILEPAINDVVK